MIGHMGSDLDAKQRDDLAVQFHDRIAASDDTDALVVLKPLAHVARDVLSEAMSIKGTTIPHR